MSNQNGAYKSAFWLSVFIGLFLLVFKPFGLHKYQHAKTYVIIGYGVVCFLTFMINASTILRYFRKRYQEESWKVYHQILWILWNLLTIGISCFLYAIWIGAFSYSLKSFLKLELYILITSIIPITVLVLLKYIYVLKQHLKLAMDINRQIHENHTLPTPVAEHIHENVVPNQALNFTSENEKEKLCILPEQILFIESEENYVEFYWKENSKIHKSLLRSTLYKIEEQLKELPAFFRSHRSFIVNLNAIESVVGNSQGYQLRFQNVEKMVPVARSRGKALKDLLYKSK